MGLFSKLFSKRVLPEGEAGIGIYVLDKAITEFQAQELTEFSEFSYDHLLTTYGIRRLFPNEVFYTATNKAFLRYEATEAVVAALHGLIYKVYFDFIQASAEENKGLREEVSAYVAGRCRKPTEVRDLPNGMRVAIWDTDFGNVIIESDYMHTALIFTSSAELAKMKTTKPPMHPKYVALLGITTRVWHWCLAAYVELGEDHSARDENMRHYLSLCVDDPNLCSLLRGPARELANHLLYLDDRLKRPPSEPALQLKKLVEEMDRDDPNFQGPDLTYPGWASLPSSSAT